MVTPISEEDARRALRDVDSEASNPKLYAATRRSAGWLFGWRLQNGAPRMGTRTWIVADNGVARRLDFREHADDGIAAALAGDPPDA